MPFEIIRNDITRVKADAVVNTANPHPVIGAGTDSAIHRAAGPRLLSARQRIGEIAVGASKETPAFDLPAKYVLHTVSPVWEGGTHGERELLCSAYDAALALADRLSCRSVAFPLLSAGSYGFPQDVALSVAIQAFTDFLLSHDMRIILVLFAEKPFSLAQGLFGDLRAYVDDRFVSEAKAVEYDGAARPFVRRRDVRVKAAAARPMLAEKQPRPCAAALDTAEESAANDLESLFRDAESTFSEHLLDLLNERGEKDADVYRRAQISRQLFHKIISKKDYQPTKNTAIQLAIGLKLDVTGTQQLLHKAGFALTRSSKQDLVVQYFIERGVYSIVEINLALYDCGLPLLKTGSA